jgi:hypothetical protein
MLETTNLTTEDLFAKMWDSYSKITPSANNILEFFKSKGEDVYNDHVALRTLNDQRVDIEKVSQLLLELGYVEGGEYHFTEKKLYAKHFYHPTENHPKVFISQLLVEEFSEELQQTMKSIIDNIDFTQVTPLTLLTSGRLWSTPSYETLDVRLGVKPYKNITLGVAALNIFDENYNNHLKNGKHF